MLEFTLESRIESQESRVTYSVITWIGLERMRMWAWWAWKTTDRMEGSGFWLDQDLYMLQTSNSVM